MGYRGRIYFTEQQKAEIWDRWQRGESMSSIGRRFDRNSSSIYPVLARTGGIRPAERRRSRLALTLAEREEISRGLHAQLSLRAIARQLRRVPSAISREVSRNGARAQRTAQKDLAVSLTSREVRRVCCGDRLNRQPKRTHVKVSPRSPHNPVFTLAQLRTRSLPRIVLLLPP